MRAFLAALLLLLLSARTHAAGGDFIKATIDGKVVEGTFCALLHGEGKDIMLEVTNGAFRFTMEYILSHE